MPSFFELLPFHRRRRPQHGPVPQLLPDWPDAGRRRLGAGIYLRRLGGAQMLTPRGQLPRLRGIEAVRGYCLTRLPLSRIALLVDGKVVQVGPAVPVTTQTPSGLRKYVFNLWHDFGEFEPGMHRLSVRPVGFGGRLLARRRRVVIQSRPPAAPDTDAYIPQVSGATSPEAAVASLSTRARSTRRSVLPASVQSILVVRADQLGDLAVSVPAILRLRALFPTARITGLVTAYNQELAASLGLFDHLIVAAFDSPRRTVTLEEQERLARELADTNFDIAVDLGEGAQSRLLLLLADAGFRYGFRNGNHNWLSASFEFNARDPANGMEVMPPSAKLLALVEALGALRPREPVVLPPPRPGNLAAYRIAPDERFIVLHTGARLACSRWPGFGKLAELLLDRTPHRLVIFTHGAPWETPARPPAHLERLHIVEGQLPFAEFDRLLGSCAVFVGNDSGPKHLAALRGAKVVSLHMARLNWNEWGQEGDGLILSRRVPCAGCNVGDQPDECGRDYTCIRSITPEEVCAAVLSLL